MICWPTKLVRTHFCLLSISSWILAAFLFQDEARLKPEHPEKALSEYEKEPKQSHSTHGIAYRIRPLRAILR